MKCIACRSARQLAIFSADLRRLGSGGIRVTTAKADSSLERREKRPMTPALDRARDPFFIRNRREQTISPRMLEGVRGDVTGKCPTVDLTAIDDIWRGRIVPADFWRRTTGANPAHCLSYPVNNAPFAEIIGRHLKLYAIAQVKADEAFPHLT